MYAILAIAFCTMLGCHHEKANWYLSDGWALHNTAAECEAAHEAFIRDEVGKHGAPVLFIRVECQKVGA